MDLEQQFEELQQVVGRLMDMTAQLNMQAKLDMAEAANSTLKASLANSNESFAKSASTLDSKLQTGLIQISRQVEMIAQSMAALKTNNQQMTDTVRAEIKAMMPSLMTQIDESRKTIASAVKDTTAGFQKMAGTQVQTMQDIVSESESALHNVKKIHAISIVGTIGIGAVIAIIFIGMMAAGNWITHNVVYPIAVQRAIANDKWLQEAVDKMTKDEWQSYADKINTIRMRQLNSAK